MGIPVQLGWIQSAINYVFDKVINPIFSWVTNLLSDVFKWVFNTILGPLLESAFSLISQTVGKYIMRAVGRLLYLIEKCFLQLLDMMQSIFDVLAGTQKVSDSATNAEGSLLSVLVRTPFVTKTMFVVISISIALTFLFAIVATIKSIGEMGGSQSKPVGHVIKKLAYAMLRMLTAPLMGLFLVVLGDAVLMSITNAMTMGGNVTIARSLFVISSLDAVDDEFGAVDKYGVKHKGGQRLELSFSNQYVSASTQIGDWNNPILAYNYSTRSTYLASHPGEGQDYGMKDLYREPFYTGAKDYTKSVDVDATFNVGRLDYFVGIGGSLLFIFLLGSALFTFTSRLFDVIILLIIEPLFIAPMPLDDGEHFQKWEDMFIGKLFSGYGMVVAMYLYLLVCGMVFDGRISFTPRSDMGDIMMDMLMRIIVLIGGAATIMTAGPLVTSILSSAAAGQETAAQGAGMAFTAGTVMKPFSYGAETALDYASDKIAGKFGLKKDDLGLSKLTGGKEDGTFGEGKKDTQNQSSYPPINPSTPSSFAGSQTPPAGNGMPPIGTPAPGGRPGNVTPAGTGLGGNGPTVGDPGDGVLETPLDEGGQPGNNAAWRMKPSNGPIAQANRRQGANPQGRNDGQLKMDDILEGGGLEEVDNTFDQSRK